MYKYKLVQTHILADYTYFFNDQHTHFAHTIFFVLKILLQFHELVIATNPHINAIVSI